jgi:hypothetical protein
VLVIVLVIVILLLLLLARDRRAVFLLPANRTEGVDPLQFAKAGKVAIGREQGQPVLNRTMLAWLIPWDQQSFPLSRAPRTKSAGMLWNNGNRTGPTQGVIASLANP